MSPQLFAWLTALLFALANTTVRQGLRYSTPITGTFVSLTVHTIVLWVAVYVTSGIPKVALLAVFVICITGVLQPVMRFCHYTGMDKIGTSRCDRIR